MFPGSGRSLFRHQLADPQAVADGRQARLPDHPRRRRRRDGGGAERRRRRTKAPGSHEGGNRDGPDHLRDDTGGEEDRGRPGKARPGRVWANNSAGCVLLTAVCGRLVNKGCRPPSLARRNFCCLCEPKSLLCEFARSKHRWRITVWHRSPSLLRKWCLTQF